MKDYLHSSASLDRAATPFLAGLPGGWMLVGLAGLALGRLGLAQPSVDLVAHRGGQAGAAVAAVAPPVTRFSVADDEGATRLLEGVLGIEVRERLYIGLTLGDPVEAWRSEINNALMDAMLEHSRGLGIRPDEWLCIAARGNYERPPLAPADSNAQTVVIRIRGTDLTSFLGGQISHDDARKRMDVKVF